MHKKTFSAQFITGESKLEDFALLAGCLTFLWLEGYLQFQYNLFGNRYGIAAFIPAVFFLFFVLTSSTIAAYFQWVLPPSLLEFA
jgi:hypothetical protein